MKDVDIFKAESGQEANLQFASGGIHAGFPSPAQDYIEDGIDLNKELIRHKASTFYGRVVGDSMTEAGIDEGDIIVIDPSHIAICSDKRNRRGVPYIIHRE